MLVLVAELPLVLVEVLPVVIVLFVDTDEALVLVVVVEDDDTVVGVVAVTVLRVVGVDVVVLVVSVVVKVAVIVVVGLDTEPGVLEPSGVGSSEVNVVVADVKEASTTVGVGETASAQQRTENTDAVSSWHSLSFAVTPSPNGTRWPPLHTELVQICFQSRAQPVPDDALRRISSYVHRRAPTDPHSDNASL